MSYRVSDIEGEFITQAIVSNTDDEDLYYFELYNYGCDVNETSFVEFESAISEDMILKGIEEYLDYSAESFLSWHIFDLFDCVTLYDVNTAERVYISSEDKELLKVSRFEHIVELESYEIEEF